MQDQIRQDEKQEQGWNDGNQDYTKVETDEKTLSDPDTKELTPLVSSTESIARATNNELYELLMQLRGEIARISGTISEVKDILADYQDDTEDSDSGSSEEGSSDDDSPSDYGNVDDSEGDHSTDDSTDDSDSDGYSTDEFRGKSRGSVTDQP